MQQSTRPIFINLLQIRFPVSAIVSIGHRGAGIFMILVIPALITALGMSSTPDGYARLLEFFSAPWVRIVLFLVIWAFAHHFFAGLRFILIDLDIGTSKEAKTRSAWIVQVAGLAVALICFGGILL